MTNKHRLLIKRTDLAGQLACFIIPLLLFLFTKDPRTLIKSIYIAVGAWQLVSLLVHQIMGPGVFGYRQHRVAIQWFVYTYLSITALGAGTHEGILYFMLIIWYLIGPFVYLWHAWICAKEISRLAQIVKA
jgi:hypothetical protein